MKTDKPTPIPKRASRPKPEPKPLIIPQPDRNITVMPNPHPPISDELRELIALEIRKALDVNNANLYHLLDRSEADIIEMGEAQFKALMRDVRNAE